MNLAPHPLLVLVNLVVSDQVAVCVMRFLISDVPNDLINIGFSERKGAKSTLPLESRLRRQRMIHQVR